MQVQNSKFLDKGSFSFPNVSIFSSKMDSKHIIPLSFPLSLWKKKFVDSVGPLKELLWHQSSALSVSIFLTKDDVLNHLNEHKISSSSATEFKNSDDRFFVYKIEADESNRSGAKIVALPIQSFMRLSFVPSKTFLTSKARDPSLIFSVDILEKSFSHKLSAFGQANLNWLKINILQRYSEWSHPQTTINAPICSLSQGSGTGKSKLAVEAIKSGPGFYIVLRPDTNRANPQTGYPSNNELSEELKKLVKKFDPYIDLREYPYHLCGIGNILMFFAQIITNYLRKWHNLLVDLIYDDLVKSIKEAVSPSDITYFNSKIIDLCNYVCEELGKVFEKNDELDCSFLNNMDLIQFIVNSTGRPEPKVKSLSKYISDILKLPSKAAPADDADMVNSTEAVSEEYKELVTFKRKLAWIALGNFLHSFPFLFILDEADELNNRINPGAMSQFENLRRAISYIEMETNVFYLTLGTKTDVHNLNLPICENSARIPLRNRSLSPIILLSNTSIFSQEYPIEKIKINHKILKNPVFLKFLVTLGHPLWCSVPFDKMISVAFKKIINGTSKTLDYVLVLWMVRAGLMANSIDLNTRSLVASHMATIFDFSPDLVHMIVFYPSEPVMAIACRCLMYELAMAGNFHFLFQKLNEMLEAVKIDSGNLAEVVGSMIILIAIDEAENSAGICLPGEIKKKPLILKHIPFVM
jgi:hypothetical protein